MKFKVWQQIAIVVAVAAILLMAFLMVSGPVYPNQFAECAWKSAEASITGKMTLNGQVYVKNNNRSFVKNMNLCLDGYAYLNSR